MMTLSIIVPIYGVEQYICQCADSLLSQTSDRVEFIFVNDGTKDRSLILLKKLIDEKYQHLLDRIIILDEENAGVSAARRKGLEAASGDYVLFCDSDDWIELDTSALLMAEADRTHADLIYFDLYKEYTDRTRVCRERNYLPEEKELFICNLFNYKTRGYLVTKCFKRSLFLEHEIFFSPYQMHDDIYVSVQMVFYAKSFAHLNAPLYHYRLDNPMSASSSNRRNRRMQSSRNMMDLYHHFQDCIPESPINAIVGDIFMTSGWNSIVYRLNLFSEFPELAQGIRNARFSRLSRLSFPAQLIIKTYALFK